MPNHVYTNTEYHTTDPEQRATIKRLAEAGESIIAHYVPLPDAYTEERAWTDSEGRTLTRSVFVNGGIDAAYELWGSKWADYEVELADETPDLIEVRHLSAWGPSDEGLRKVSALLGITIFTSYTEESGEFVGAVVFHNGVLIASAGVGGTEYDALMGERLRAEGQPAECPDYDDDDEAWQAWQDARSAIEFDLLNEYEDAVRAAYAEFTTTLTPTV
jgi:Ferredoxin-like domain in Api92-like protein